MKVQSKYKRCFSSVLFLIITLNVSSISFGVFLSNVVCSWQTSRYLLLMCFVQISLRCRGAWTFTRRFWKKKRRKVCFCFCKWFDWNDVIQIKLYQTKPLRFLKTNIITYYFHAPYWLIESLSSFVWPFFLLVTFSLFLTYLKCICHI